MYENMHYGLTKSAKKTGVLDIIMALLGLYDQDNRIAAVMISYVVPPTAEPKSKLLSLSAPSKERCVAKKQ